MILVIPPTSSGNGYQECLNTARAQDATFLVRDVRTDVLASLRASTDPAEWGLLGYSSGGYCAANLALQYRTTFGSAAAMDGYYEASDGPAAGLLGYDPSLMADNSPVTLASRLSRHTVPIPAFWLSVGTANAEDVRQEKMLADALNPVQDVTVVTEPGQAHTFYDWSAVLPAALSWSWQQLSPPDLRVLFPGSGTAPSLLTVKPAPKPHLTSTKHKRNPLVRGVKPPRPRAASIAHTIG
jgi:S-formylglutathione hydrolase FrmB